MCFRADRPLDNQREPSQLPNTALPPRVRRLVGTAVAVVVAVVAAWAIPDLLGAKAVPGASLQPALSSPSSLNAEPAQRTALLVDDEVPLAAGDKASSSHCDH